MRLLRLLPLTLVVVFALMLSMAFVASADGPAPARTYDVKVGLGDVNKGVEVMAFFPDTVTIHVGDTVRWTQNTNEIHTVTFLAGGAMPDFIVPGADPSVSPIMLNPVVGNPAAPAGGQYDGSTYANSGLMGLEPGQVQQFSLTFTQEGTFDYVCVIHGAMMSGKVVVVGNGVRAPSPRQAIKAGKEQMEQQMRLVPGVIRAAKALEKPDTVNPDGTKTHYIEMGYNDGQIDLVSFFPSKVNVRPGDTVTWEMSAGNVAPHTVTFFNGTPDPGLITVVPQPGGPPLLYLNAAVLFPSQPSSTLTRTGYYNSGFMEPIPGMAYSLVIGDIAPGPLPYECQLHDTSGMTGVLNVLPAKGHGDGGSDD